MFLPFPRFSSKIITSFTFKPCDSILNVSLLFTDDVCSFTRYPAIPGNDINDGFDVLCVVFVRKLGVFFSLSLPFNEGHDGVGGFKDAERIPALKFSMLGIFNFFLTFLFRVTFCRFTFC